MAIRQITIVGTGLIGGSLGLALREQDFPGTIVGCDRPEVLNAALIRGAIDRGETDARQAVQGSDVVVLATPIGGILSTFEKLAPTLPPARWLPIPAVLKLQFVERARMVFGAEAGMRVLPGHPMAGKERGGIENADADLFRDAVWLITPIDAEQPVHRTAAGVHSTAGVNRGAGDRDGSGTSRSPVRVDQPPAADDGDGAGVDAARRTRATTRRSARSAAALCGR